jgi:HlyD family secretion protein
VSPRHRSLLGWVIALVVIGGLGTAAAHFLTGRGADRDAVPSIVVTKTPFVRRVTTDGNLRALKATQLSAPRTGGDMMMKIAWLADDGTLVKANDVVVRFDPSEGEKQMRDGKSDLESASAKLQEETIRSRTAVEDRDSDAVLAGQELEQTRAFQAKDPTIFSRNDIIESAIDEHLAGVKQTHAEHAKAIERKLSSSKAGLIAVDQQKAKITIAHAKTQLESMEIRAPHDGIFVMIRDWRGEMPRIGEQLWPGQPVAEIPLLDTMEAELFVLEVDGSGLAIGQPAEVIDEAHPEIIYKGKVRLVDKLAKPRQPGVPVQYFAVVIELEKTDHATMKPGQRVHGTVILDQEDALVVPRESVVNKEGKNFVFRQGAKGWDTVEVELGAATSGRVVVKSGLAAGDRIALRDPTRSLEQLGSGSSAPATSAPPKPGPP